jgi:hypothetical protein
MKKKMKMVIVDDYSSGYPPHIDRVVKKILKDRENLFKNWDKGRCCPTDSCNDGAGKCNGSCEKGKKKK